MGSGWKASIPPMKQRWAACRWARWRIWLPQWKRREGTAGLGGAPMAQRASYVHKLGDAILARSEEIARIESLDTGNTIGPMRRDVNTAVDRMRFAAELAYELKGETIPSTPGNIHMTIRQPYGVIGRIIPFNHPIGFAASRIAPAIIPGNTIVVKPSEQSPLSASILARSANRSCRRAWSIS